jgi:predicted RNase H-like HicB family nuclease
MAKNVRRYVATYRREDGAWIVQFREPGIATFGRSLATAKRHARSAIAVHLEVQDLEAAGVEIVDDVRLPEGVAAEVDRLAAERTKVESMRADLVEATRRAAADLRRRGFSTRDVGEILGVTGTRVAQLEREAKAG